MKRIVRQIRQICTSTSGLSLVEVLVASAIVAIVSGMLVFALYTMGAIGMRAADVVNADTALSEQIALDGEKEGSVDGNITLNPSSDDVAPQFNVTFNTYTINGRSFTTFEYKP
jgi:prepilin-type N-terminal cleavage/methylation domain-containing protein